MFVEKFCDEIKELLLKLTEGRDAAAALAVLLRVRLPRGPGLLHLEKGFKGKTFSFIFFLYFFDHKFGNSVRNIFS